MMQCLYCGSIALKVLDTTAIKNGIRRRRECQACGERFTTYERSAVPAPILIKRNGNREDFDREKLKRGIWKACTKRPISATEIDALATRIEAHLQSLGHAEVSSRVIGDLVVEGLKGLDPIAYIRYAIVYLGLDDLLSVRAEVDNLLAEQQYKAEHEVKETEVLQNEAFASLSSSSLEQGYSRPGKGRASAQGNHPPSTIAGKRRNLTATQL